jgi:IS605 OrfB family transposase
MFGVDINPTHLALCLLNKQGNPIQFLDIPLDLTGNQRQNQDAIGVAVRKVVEYALAQRATIAHEELNFTRAKKSLRYECSRKTAKLLSSFAYRAILTTLDCRARRDGVTTIALNPAWTSLLGQVNYAGTYGVSVDQGAACAIGRRALGFSERVRPWVLGKLVGTTPTQPSKAYGAHTTAAPQPIVGSPPRSEAVGQVHQGKRTNVGTLHMVGKALRSGGSPRLRRTTWDAAGLCLRRPQWPPDTLSNATPISAAERSAQAGTTVAPTTSMVGMPMRGLPHLAYSDQVGK